MFFPIELVNPAFFWFRRNFCGYNCCLKNLQPLALLRVIFLPAVHHEKRSPVTAVNCIFNFLVLFLHFSLWSNYLSNGDIQFTGLCGVF